MNIKFLLLSFATVSIISCSTAYKSGQTPDDVYYSPVRAVDERETREEKVEQRSTDNYEEREIRMASRDRRWRDINDDYDYRYDPYRYGYNYGYYYNPYYYNRPVYITGCVIVNPKNTMPRMTNLGSYNNATLVVSDAKSGQTKWIRSNRNYNNSNSSNSSNNGGGFVRRILTPSSSNNSNNSSERSTSNDNNTRTYNPSSSSSRSSSSGSSSSGSSSGGTPVSRPTRGN